MVEPQPPPRQGLRAAGADERDLHRDSHYPPAAKAAWEGSMNLIPYQTRSKSLLVFLRALTGRIGTQPQRNVCGLHRLPYHRHEIVAQGVEVRLVSELGREGFQGLCDVVFAAVEAPIDKSLDAASEWAEKGSDGQRGGHDRELRALPSEGRSEEHTFELQSRQYIVCRLLLEKKQHYRHVTASVH